MILRWASSIFLVIIFFCGLPSLAQNSTPKECLQEARVYLADWPQTDFSKCLIDLTDVISGGPGKDGIPAIDHPVFVPVSEADLAPNAPVIELVIRDRARAYPLEVLIWHEIVNDQFAGTPVAVTYCPLCNAALVFDSRIEGQVMDFGTTGNLRRSDLIMYDRQTESWWQQYTGQAIIGEMAGAQLTLLANALVSWQEFARAWPKGEVLVPADPMFRPYGANPYVGYDASKFPFLYQGSLPEVVPAMERVVVAGDKAWSFSFLKAKKKVRDEGLVITWVPGQASALAARTIDEGTDVGTVRVQTKDGDPVIYKITFAFVVHAFEPDRPIVHED
ncbi:MAG: DUF3179 domain-containing protein [Pseudomonadota bacterium]